MLHRENPLLRSRRLAIATAITCLITSPAVADEVSLVARDGGIVITGELLSFEDEVYRIRTNLGELKVGADQVTCRGAGCTLARSTARAAAAPRGPRPQRLDKSAYITLSGSSAIGSGLMPLLIEGYAGAVTGLAELESATEIETRMSVIGEQGFGDPVARFRVLSSLSSDSFANLLGKSSQIGMSSRRITPAMARALRDNGAGSMVDPRQEHIIALDNIVVITHRTNPLGSLSIAQLAEVFAGRVTNWSELGGEDAPITVVTRNANSSTKETFEERVFRDASGGVPARQLAVDSYEQVASEVNRDPHAIGYVPFAFVRGAQPLNLVNECGMVITPDAFSARTQEYDLGRFLYLYTREDTLSGEAAAFLEFVNSEASDQVIQKSGYVDLGIARQAQDLNSHRAQALLAGDVDPYEGNFMRQMLSQMVDYDRLSSVFRFQTGRNDLTPRGEMNLARLARYIETLPSGSRLLFVGFTDSVGAFDSNLALSQARARQVMEQLVATSGGIRPDVTLETVGYGPISPASCNDAEDGRAINRRVEVWVAD